jgi:hypothetical protein
VLPLEGDRLIRPDLEAVLNLIMSGTFRAAVEATIGRLH